MTFFASPPHGLCQPVHQTRGFVAGIPAKLRFEVHPGRLSNPGFCHPRTPPPFRSFLKNDKTCCDRGCSLFSSPLFSSLPPSSFFFTSHNSRRQPRVWRTVVMCCQPGQTDGRRMSYVWCGVSFASARRSVRGGQHTAHGTRGRMNKL